MNFFIWFGFLAVCFGITHGYGDCGRCDPNAHCEVDKCVCLEGFKGNGTTCVKETSECDTCSPEAKCIDNHCRCNDGYDGNGTVCRKACTKNTTCPGDARCVNGTCVKQDCQLNCTDNARCVNDKCQCNCGFKQDGDKCVDAETMCKHCPQLSSCENVEKDCRCKSGFVLDGSCCLRNQAVAGEKRRKTPLDEVIKGDKAITWLNKVLTNIEKKKVPRKEPRKVPKYGSKQTPKSNETKPPGNPSPDVNIMYDPGVHPEKAANNQASKDKENPVAALNMNSNKTEEIALQENEVKSELREQPSRAKSTPEDKTKPDLVNKTIKSLAPPTKPTQTNTSVVVTKESNSTAQQTNLTTTYKSNATKGANSVASPTKSATTTSTIVPISISPLPTSTIRKQTEGSPTKTVSKPSFPTQNFALFPTIEIQLPSLQLYPNFQPMPQSSEEPGAALIPPPPEQVFQPIPPSKGSEAEETVEYLPFQEAFNYQPIPPSVNAESEIPLALLPPQQIPPPLAVSNPLMISSGEPQMMNNLLSGGEPYQAVQPVQAPMSYAPDIDFTLPMQLGEDVVLPSYPVSSKSNEENKETTIRKVAGKKKKKHVKKHKAKKQ